MTTSALEPIHPGEVLMFEYLKPLGITQHRVAVALHRRLPPLAVRRRSPEAEAVSGGVAAGAGQERGPRAASRRPAA